MCGDQGTEQGIARFDGHGETLRRRGLGGCGDAGGVGADVGVVIAQFFGVGHKVWQDPRLRRSGLRTR